MRVSLAALAFAMTTASCLAWAHDEPPQTVLLLHFDEGEGTVAHDASGLGNDGTIKGGPAWTGGRFGGALQFNGDGRVDAGRPEALDFAKTCDFTVECWVKVEPETPPEFYFIISTRLRLDETPGYTLYLHRNFHVLAAVGDKVNWTDALSSREAINDGRWHHLALTCDRDGQASLYVDGELQSAADMSFLVTMHNDECPLLVGSRGYSGDFVGCIDEVRISRGVRTDFSLDAPCSPDAGR